MKRDYVSSRPKADAAKAAYNIAVAVEHHNERHAHGAPKIGHPRGGS